MADFNNVRNSLGNVSRGTWLAVGLIVLAALLAATFIFGGEGDLTTRNDRDDAAEEQAVESNGEEEAAVESNDGEEPVAGDDGEVAVTGGEDESREVALPRELADTGPVAPVLAFGALALSGYLYRRSRSDLRDSQSE